MVGGMHDLCVSGNGQDDDLSMMAGDTQELADESLIGSEGELSAAADAIAQQVVRVEANFLRLPLFTLDNKHMRTLDGLQCEGTFRRGGKSFAFTYTVNRNTATYYPGPLARSAHFALLSIATDRGLPLLNPVSFTWRELCTRMGVQPSGQIVKWLREAITATKGLMIESRAALFSKADNAPITTDDRTKIINLYDEVEFSGTSRSDGSRADINAVWFSHWYLDNLNALYSAPLDHALWRSLNEKSLIASRLYEFLFLKFYGGREFLRFNYPTLVKFIPVRTERYLSHAKHQLQPAFDLLIKAGVLGKVQWIESKGGQPQLLLYRGLLLSRDSAATDAIDIGEDDFVLNRVEDIQLPEWKLVTSFHHLWGNDSFTPAKAELDLARELLATHGQAEMHELLPKVVKRLKLRWSDAKSFVAISRYLPEVIQERQREKHRMDQERQGEKQQEESRKRAIQDAQDRAVLKALWESLPSSEQEAIRSHVLKGQPPALQKRPAIIERFCLEEFAKRQGMAAGQ